MLSLLFNGQGLLFGILLLAIVLSLSLHEFGHASVATMLGDDTPGRAGRLTLNPLSHVDPMGLLLVVLVGFGYARPVPFSPARLRARWAPAAEFNVGGAQFFESHPEPLGPAQFFMGQCCLFGNCL